MRIQLVLLAAALAASVTASAGASPTRTPVVNYWIKVEFGIGIEVKWSLDSGTRNGACNTWSHEEGTYEIDAGSIGEIPAGKKRAGSFIHPIQGLQSLGKDPQWAILYAAGRAKVHMKRTLTQEGQTNACGDVAAVKTKFPPNDCGERTYVSRSAFVRPDYRDGFRTLDAILTPKLLAYKAIAIDAPAQQLLYQQCGRPAPFDAGVGVQNVALPLQIPDDGLLKLRSLRLGQRVRLEYVKSKLPCMSRLAQGFTCTAGVDLHVDIRRVKPPSGR